LVKLKDIFHMMLLNIVFLIVKQGNVKKPIFNFFFAIPQPVFLVYARKSKDVKKKYNDSNTLWQIVLQTPYNGGAVIDWDTQFRLRHLVILKKKKHFIFKI